MTDTGGWGFKIGSFSMKDRIRKKIKLNTIYILLLVIRHEIIVV